MVTPSIGPPGLLEASDICCRQMSNWPKARAFVRAGFPEAVIRKIGDVILYAKMVCVAKVRSGRGII